MTADELSRQLARVARGDRAAFATVYAATSAKLYGIALRILRRRDLADEILQEVYVRIWERAGDFDPARSSPITWMATIARNRSLDEVRRKAPVSLEDHPHLLDVADDAEPALDRITGAEDVMRLRACLEALEPERREIVRLAYLDGMSREALGQRFDRPVATIKTWLRRSLAQLKACLGQ